MATNTGDLTVKVLADEALDIAFRSRDCTLIKQELLRKTAHDRSATGIGAVLSLVPGVGGLLQAFVSEIAPNREKERLAEFVAHVAVELASIDSTMRAKLEERIVSEEFEHMFRLVADRIRKEHRVQKRDALRAMLLNTLMADLPLGPELEFLFVQYLDELHSPHLAILDLIYRDVAPSSSRVTLIAVLGQSLQCPTDVIRAYASKLDQLALTRDLVKSLDRVLGETNFKETRSLVRDLGVSFIAFVRNPTHMDSGAQ